jgi:hypothetical protein
MMFVEYVRFPLAESTFSHIINSPKERKVVLMKSDPHLCGSSDQAPGRSTNFKTTEKFIGEKRNGITGRKDSR